MAFQLLDIQKVITKQPKFFVSEPDTSRPTSVFSTPRYGWFSQIREPETRLYFNDLHQLVDQQKFAVGRRKDGCYTISDRQNTLLYIAALRSETKCCCCEVPKGSGISFKMFTTSEHPILVIQTYEKNVCLSPNDFEGDVKVLPDLSLGTMEGSIARGFKLNSVSRELICTINAIYDGCCLCDRFYEIIPINSPHDIGTIVVEGGELLVTFPRVMDVPRRALVLACVISMKYQLERNTIIRQC